MENDYDESSQRQEKITPVCKSVEHTICVLLIFSMRHNLQGNSVGGRRINEIAL